MVFCCVHGTTIEGTVAVALTFATYAWAIVELASVRVIYAHVGHDCPTYYHSMLRAICTRLDLAWT